MESRSIESSALSLTDIETTLGHKDPFWSGGGYGDSKFRKGGCREELLIAIKTDVGNVAQALCVRSLMKCSSPSSGESIIN